MMGLWVSQKEMHSSGHIFGGDFPHSTASGSSLLGCNFWPKSSVFFVAGRNACVCMCDSYCGLNNFLFLNMLK